MHCSLLGCPEGRSAAGWVDYNLFGHQIVCHHVKGYNAGASANAVDGDPVPVPHFGLALSVEQFHNLADRVKEAGVKFVIKPHLRFAGNSRLFANSSGCTMYTIKGLVRDKWRLSCCKSSSALAALGHSGLHQVTA